MKCPNCGYDNPAYATSCSSCGKALSASEVRRCVSCGRSIAWEANVCPYCGKDYRPQALPGQQGPLISSGMRILLYIVSFLVPIAGFVIGAIYYTKPEQEYKHVGKICIVLGIVAIVVTVGLSALLYVLVLGFGSSDGDHTPAINISRKSSIANGFKLEFTAPTIVLAWSDVTIQLSDGMDFATWSPSSGHLTSSSPATYTFLPEDLGSLAVTLGVVDLAGNGNINNGDYITFTTSSGTFSASTTYTMIMIYEPTGGAMVAFGFAG